MSILVLLGLFLLLGSIFGWIAFFKLGSLQSKVDELQRLLNKAVEEDRQTTARPDPWSGRPEKTGKSAAQPQTVKPLPVVPAADKPASVPAPLVAAARTGTATSSAEIKLTKQHSPLDMLIEDIKAHWMIWLGGICVALSGVFMVKYGIDSGLLGPKGRIALGIISGILLHAGAEWLRRRRGGPHPSFAALAGGASITLYAALLAALQMYQLMPPITAFVLLAMVSLATLFLSLRHGPVLAILGLLGAYVVPILVSTGSSNITGAMIYSLIISAAALLLMRYVYRYWLWLGMLAGAMGWWLISLSGFDAVTFRGHYLAIFAYLVLAVPAMKLTLNRELPDDNPLQQLWPLEFLKVTPVSAALMLIVAAAALSMMTEFGIQDGHQFLYHWAPITAIVVFAAGYQQVLRWLAWPFLLLQVMAIFASSLSWSDQSGFHLTQISGNTYQFLTFAFFMTLIFSGLALHHLRHSQAKNPHLWSSLLMLSPMVWLALAYLLVSDLSRSLNWGVFTLVFGFGYLLLAGRRLQAVAADVPAIWLIFGGHAGYSLAAAMLFREAGLTLALAAQLFSLAWLIRHFRLSSLDWLVKLIILIIVARLTFNPWLLSYPQHVHWSLWTYGGATLFAVLAALQLKENTVLSKWLEAAALHLLVLTLAAELRYWLYDGEIFSERYSLTEASINTVLWSALSLCYYYRSRFAQSLAGFYVLLSDLLLIMSFLNYLLVLSAKNPLWQADTVSPFPIVNLLLLAYGAPVLMALLVRRFHRPQYAREAAFTAGVGLFVFVSMEIRHLWQGMLNIHSATSSGELYTYSIVWLLLAVAAILVAYLKSNHSLYRAGVALLGLVIAKIFLIDMSDLEGLLRVASFMGLGLALLGLAYLHRSLAPTAEDGQKTAS